MQKIVIGQASYADNQGRRQDTSYQSREQKGDDGGPSPIVFEEDGVLPKAYFFVIKSFNEEDIEMAMKHNVWSSTPAGNRALAAAWKHSQKISPSLPIYLFFSTNGSGKFCAVAQMFGSVDFSKTESCWACPQRYPGSFPVRFLLKKDILNKHLSHICLPNNDFRPITHSRDVQQVLSKEGEKVLKIFNVSNMVK